MKNKNSLISVEDVTFEYIRRGSLYREIKTKAIENISFEINEGELVAIVGPSGCGKTTILKLISGLETPTSGDVYVSGKKVEGPIKNVGMAFQNPVLLPWRTILKNVLLPFEIKRNNEESRETFVNRARNLLKTVGLDGFEEKMPGELSGGMQQRANLCRALVHNPRILLLDEPFAALDIFTKEEHWVMLRKLWLDQKTTIVFITHDLREAVFLAERVYVLSGRPGTVIGEKKLDFPISRDIDITFTKEFNEIVQDLRGLISD